MTIRYCGAGGNDGNSGLTWALRKATLNGLEDSPVAAGDVCYIGPGVYRELLTCDVSGDGVSGPITYIGDVLGEHTDGIGGIVRITGSDDDQSATRANCITDGAQQRDYRTFRGFLLDTTTSMAIAAVTAGTDWTIEDCAFQDRMWAHPTGANQRRWTFRRCYMMTTAHNSGPLQFKHTSNVDDAGHIIENCVFTGYCYGVDSLRIGGIAVRNCLFLGNPVGIRSAFALTAGQTITVNNSIFVGCGTAISSAVLGDVVENCNTFFGNSTDRSNVEAGANSVTYPPLLDMPILNSGAGQVSGYKFPWLFGSLSPWSQVRAIAGASEPAVDLFGVARPATAAKNSWGAVQFQGQIRDVATVRGGAASLKLPDAGRAQFFVPTAGAAITISVYVYREANYAGTNPQMVIKQPGQADRTTTDVGAAAGWNLLTDTFTPDASTDFVVVELVSNNTAVAGSYAVYYDDLSVS